jgi:hypothetical protein
MEATLDKDPVVSQFEEDGIILLEKWIQLVFHRFGTYGLEAKVNIPYIFREIDKLSEDYLNSLNIDQLTSIFFVSLELRGFQSLAWIEKKNDGRLVQARLQPTPEFPFTTATMETNSTTLQSPNNDEIFWKVLRSNQANEDALQKILISLAALAFVFQYMDDLEKFDRAAFSALEGEVATLGYPSAVRNQILRAWNSIQRSREGNHSYIL